MPSVILALPDSMPTSRKCPPPLPLLWINLWTYHFHFIVQNDASQVVSMLHTSGINFSSNWDLTACRPHNRWQSGSSAADHEPSTQLGGVCHQCCGCVVIWHSTRWSAGRDAEYALFWQGESNGYCVPAKQSRELHPSLPLVKAAHIVNANTG